MRLRALHTSGMLDVSSQESLQVYNESEPFRLALSPGQVVEVEDHWRKLKNIDNAIKCGLLEVLEYNYSHVGEEVTHAELNQTLEDYLKRDDLSIDQLPPSGTGELTYDPVTGVFTYTPPYCGSGCTDYLRLEISVYPQEIPDDINRTFTLPPGHIYEPNTIALILNGQTLPKADIIENAGNRTVTLHPDVSTPKAGDVVVLIYIRVCSSVATSEVPVETPNGINRTFTLQNGDEFKDDNIAIMINGIMVAPDCIIKSPLGTSITLVSTYPAPEIGDIVTLMYTRVDDYPLVINEYSVEQPNDSHRTFTLHGSETYVTEKIELLINGQRLPKADFMENAAKTSLTLHPAVSTPETGDSATLIYVKPV